eukprot:scaffold748_cov251-Pinguiococcus_pyrenoidosus.AAC.8
MEANMRQLQRSDPAINMILARAAHSVVYRFVPESGQWERHGVEGPLFVVRSRRRREGGERGREDRENAVIDALSRRCKGRFPRRSASRYSIACLLRPLTWTFLGAFE